MEIVILTSHPGTGCAFYRSVGVLQQLQKLDSNIQIRMSESSHWSAIGGADIVFLERPQDERFVKAIQDCKAMGIPVWSDFDDDLFNLEKDNPGYSFYSKKSTQIAIHYCLANSDIVTVSTLNIWESFSKRILDHKKILVIPNALNDYFFPLQKKHNENPIISWRGSATHRNDLLFYSSAMHEIAEKHPAIEWHFFGKDLWYVTEKTETAKGIENSFVYGEMDLMEYYWKFNSVCPSVHIIPLLDNHFNQCKSNCSWIEATWAGAASVVPSFPEFKKVSKVSYGARFAFKTLTEELTLNKNYRKEVYEESYETLEKNLLLSNINKTRLQIVQNLRSK
jgi:hypothetical protein